MEILGDLKKSLCVIYYVDYEQNICRKEAVGFYELKKQFFKFTFLARFSI